MGVSAARPTDVGLALTADEGRESITPSNFGTGTAVRFRYIHGAKRLGSMGNGRLRATLDEAGAPTRGCDPARSVRALSISQMAVIAARSKRQHLAVRGVP